MSRDAPEIAPAWGEPGLTPAEKVFGWNTFEVIAFKTYDDHVNAARMATMKHFVERAERAIRRLQRESLADDRLNPAMAAASAGGKDSSGSLGSTSWNRSRGSSAICAGSGGCRRLRRGERRRRRAAQGRAVREIHYRGWDRREAISSRNLPSERLLV